jgi:hypothetical protein
VTAISNAQITDPHAHVGAMEDQLHKLENGSFIKLRVRYIQTLVMSRNGPLFLKEGSKKQKSYQ